MISQLYYFSAGSCRSFSYSEINRFKCQIVSIILELWHTKFSFVFLHPICYNLRGKNPFENCEISIYKEVVSVEYKTKGVCSKQIHFDIVDNKVRNVSFVGGCNGNLQGLSRLIEGMDVNEAISRIDGIKCGFKSTSCPDQLAQALKEAVAAGN